jgi:hypothetical protein
LDGLQFQFINEAVWVEQAFEEMEVFEVVKDMNGVKALGPDGFPMDFFQSCWHFVKKDVMKVFLEFHQQRSLRKV